MQTPSVQVPAPLLKEHTLPSLPLFPARSISAADLSRSGVPKGNNSPIPRVGGGVDGHARRAALRVAGVARSDGTLARVATGDAVAHRAYVSETPAARPRLQVSRSFSQRWRVKQGRMCDLPILRIGLQIQGDTSSVDEVESGGCLARGVGAGTIRASAGAVGERAHVADSSAGVDEGGQQRLR